MSLFKKIFAGKEKTTPEQPMQPLKEPLTPQEMTQRASTLAQMNKETLEEYEYMLNNGKNLNILEYDQVLVQFKALAQDFEKIYELMTFDKEKIEEIAKYNEKAKIKREELKKQLSGKENAKETKDTKQSPKK